MTPNPYNPKPLYKISNPYYPVQVITPIKLNPYDP